MTRIITLDHTTGIACKRERGVVVQEWHLTVRERQLLCDLLTVTMVARLAIIPNDEDAPVFRTLAEVGLVDEDDGGYVLTEDGRQIATLGGELAKDRGN